MELKRILTIVCVEYIYIVIRITRFSISILGGVLISLEEGKSVMGFLLFVVSKKYLISHDWLSTADESRA